jgi:hypothetical protein
MSVLAVIEGVLLDVHKSKKPPRQAAFSMPEKYISHSAYNQ